MYFKILSGTPVMVQLCDENIVFYDHINVTQRHERHFVQDDLMSDQYSDWMEEPGTGGKNHYNFLEKTIINRVKGGYILNSILTVEKDRVLIIHDEDETE